MVALDGVGDAHNAEPVVGTPPAWAGHVAASLKGLVDLCVAEAFVLPLVPAEAAEGTDIGGNLLVGVDAKAIFDGGGLRVCRDDGDGRTIAGRPLGEGGCDGIAVDAHVAMVFVGEKAQGAVPVGLAEAGEEALERGVPQLELVVFAPCPAQIPVQIDAVGNGGHQGDAVTEGPGVVVVLGDRAVGVTAGVRGVVVGAVVIDGPVHELEVGVGARTIEIEGVR